MQFNGGSRIATVRKSNVNILGMRSFEIFNYLLLAIILVDASCAFWLTHKVIERVAKDDKIMDFYVSFPHSYTSHMMLNLYNLILNLQI